MTENDRMQTVRQSCPMCTKCAKGAPLVSLNGPSSAWVSLTSVPSALMCALDCETPAEPSASPPPPPPSPGE